MADYKQYVSFELPEWTADSSEVLGGDGVLGDLLPLSGELLNDIERSLEEIASTPEGAALLEKAAAMSDGGKINFFFNDGGETAAYIAVGENDVLIGSENLENKYATLNGDLNFSLQRAIVHELHHIVLNHGEKSDPETGELSLEHEEEATHHTNIFMEKYYNEPPRTDYEDGDIGGTPHWDINPDFRAEGYDPANPEITMFGMWQKVGSEWGRKFSGMSPELESLYELRNDFELFQAQWDELMENGGIEVVQAELNDIIALEPVVVAESTIVSQSSDTVFTPPQR